MLRDRMMMRSRAFNGSIFGFRESGLPMDKWNSILDAWVVQLEGVKSKVVVFRESYDLMTQGQHLNDFFDL